MELHSFQQNTYSQSTSVDRQYETPTGVCKWTVGLQIVTTCSCLFNHSTCPYRHWQDSERDYWLLQVCRSDRPFVRLSVWKNSAHIRRDFH